jgi:hypothetical protein
LQKALIDRRIDPAVSDRGSIDDTVKRCPEIVNAISGYKCPSVEGRAFPEVSYKAVAASIGITFLGDYVRVSALPCKDFRFEDFEVFFGAANFQQGTSELRTDHGVFAGRDSAAAFRV